MESQCEPIFTLKLQVVDGLDVSVLLLKYTVPPNIAVDHAGLEHFLHKGMTASSCQGEMTFY